MNFRIEDRVQRFFSDVRSNSVYRVQDFKKIALERPDTEEGRFYLPILQYLIFGKATAVGPEEPWFLQLNEEEISKLKVGAPLMCTSDMAFYPERVGKWNVMNQIVDLCLLSFDSIALEEKWHSTINNSGVYQRHHEQGVERFLEHLRRTPLFPNIRTIAIRGQVGQDGRIPGKDVNLLVMLDREDQYYKLFDIALEFCNNHCLEFTEMTFLGTDFSEANNHSFSYTTNDTSGLLLDIYATVGRKELTRVLFGNPIESRWNLEVLKTCRPVLGEQWFRDFITSYETAIGIRAKFVKGSFMETSFTVSFSQSELAHARNAGVTSLAKCTPRIEMWNIEGLVSAFQSPFVAALLIETIGDDFEVDQKLDLVDYLFATMEKGGLWRFAPHTFPEWQTDMDDTVCALAALKRFGKVEHDDSINIYLDRFSTQIAPSGLLRTWLVPKRALFERVNDPDPVVTANAAFFMHRIGLGDNPFTIRIEQAILQHLIDHDGAQLSSLYYNRFAICAYFLARWAATSHSPAAREVLARINKRISAMDVRTFTVCELAATISTAVWVGAEDILTSALPLLLAFQKSSGMWHSSPFFVDPGGSFYGSPEITTALAVEAIGLSLHRGME